VGPLRGKGERIALAVLLAVFAWFSCRGIIFFFSGDDMMNMHGAWLLNPWRLGRSLIEIWIPIYRPLGAAVYRVFYAAFGFHPLPLYIFCWLLLAINVVLSWRFFRTVLPARYAALTAVSLVLVHGNFQDLYLSAGTIYDRLWFLFTVLGLTLYARMRGPVDQALVCLMCLLAMDSKESGVALPVLLAFYELLFKPWKSRLKQLAPLYGVLAVICLLFVYGRVHHTPELAMNAAYAPKLRIGLWLTHMAEYFTILFYKHIAFTKVTTAAVLIAMALAAALLRNRAMIFGLLFFVITVTPVALISSRPGYVLYVPDIGLGLFLAAMIGQLTKDRLPAVSFAAVTALMLWFHLSNWPPPFNPNDSPELRLTEQFRRDYPTMPKGAKLLFVNDGFPREAYDLLFNLRLMYRDHEIRADRVSGPPDQQPNPAHPETYDHAFVYESGRYHELDNRDLAESQRLHILKGYTVGREMSFENRDYASYLVSGIDGGEFGEPTRWTSPEAKLKFDVYPAPAVFSMKFWVPDFVAKTGVRTMHIKVDGTEIADYPLSKDGMNEPSFDVPVSAIALNGFTVVEIDVENPWKDKDGTALGVVLLRAGFAYRLKR
jgi:hypothetical protein